VAHKHKDPVSLFSDLLPENLKSVGKKWKGRLNPDRFVSLKSSASLDSFLLFCQQGLALFTAALNYCGSAINEFLAKHRIRHKAFFALFLSFL
jgi:hypothetical protein